MPETTNFVTQINIDGTICEIKDSVARTDAASAKSTADTASTNATNALNKANSATTTATTAKSTADAAAKDASSAKTTATTASNNATSALNKVNELEKLPRVTVTYNPTETTIKVVTTNTHATT